MSELKIEFGTLGETRFVRFLGRYIFPLDSTIEAFTEGGPIYLPNGALIVFPQGHVVLSTGGNSAYFEITPQERDEIVSIMEQRRERANETEDRAAAEED